jgi:hypothetical protein
MGRKKAKQKDNSQSRWVRTWVKILTAKEIDELRQRLAEKGHLWDQWEYKLHRGNIVIYTPITPWDPTTCQPDPERRYLAKHLRIVPSVPGPYQLEYYRHTGQWWPLPPCVGDIKDMADFIAADECGLCSPPEVPESVSKAREEQKRRS